MIESDIEYLCCPKCNADLFFSELTKDKSECVVRGVAICSTCKIRYPVVNYVMIFVPRNVAEKLLAPEVFQQYLMYKCADDGTEGQYHRNIVKSGENWNEQIGNVFKVTNESLAGDGFWGKDSFWRFCGLQPSQLANKNICVYCGGSGREAFHLLSTEAERVFVIDVGSHIFNVQNLCEGMNGNLVLLMTDFYHNPIKFDCIDVSICDHALQHIENNKKAYAYIANKTKVEGLVSICVYSHENNFLMTKIIEPSKIILHKLPNSALMKLAFLPATLLYFLHKIYLLLSLFLQKTSSRLPFYDLFCLWGRDGYSKFHEACFDLLHAPISYHFKESELLEMAMSNSLNILQLKMINKTMWTMVAQKHAQITRPCRHSLQPNSDGGEMQERKE